MTDSVNPFEPPADTSYEEDEFVGRSAGLLARLGGAVIDRILVWAGLWLTPHWAWWLPEIPSSFLFYELAWLLLAVPVHCVVNGYLLAKRGQTVGKLVVGTRIVNATDGRRASFFRIVFLRLLPFELLVLVPFAGPYLVLADALAILRKDRRCLHDLVAGTRVVLVE